MILSRCRATLPQHGFGSVHDGEGRGIHVPVVGRTLDARVRPRYSVRQPKLKWRLRPDLPLLRRVRPRWKVIPTELAARSDRRRDAPMRSRILTWFLNRSRVEPTRSLSNHELPGGYAQPTGDRGPRPPPADLALPASW